MKALRRTTRPANPRADHNIKKWAKVGRILHKDGTIARNRVILGDRQFVGYCEDILGWLEAA